MKVQAADQARGLRMDRRFGSSAGTLVIVACAAVVSLVRPAASQEDVAAFYVSKSISMIVGFPTGGGSDVYGRIVAKHIGKHIPGNPRVIVRNMPGAGSLTAASYIFNSAPRDGTILGSVAQGIPLEARLRGPQARYDPTRFYWIGRQAPTTHVTMVWHTSKIRTLADAKHTEVPIGATGAASAVSLYPSVMNDVLKTKFKIVMGYKGSAEAMLAMERGEMEGHSTSWELLKAIHQDWLEAGKLRFLVQHGLARSPGLPDVQTSVEAATNDEDRAVMRVIMSTTEVGRSYFTTPEVPADRVAALRRAFDSMMKDPEFVAAINQIQGDIIPMNGETLQNLVDELDSIPQPLIERVKTIYTMQ